MVTDKQLVEEFNFIGVDGLDEKLVQKCIEIATRYNIDAERFVEEWIAFAQTNLSGILKPTAITLDTMERKQLSKNSEKSNVKVEIKAEHAANGGSVVSYNKNSSNTDVNKILNAYNAGTTPEKFKQGIKRDAPTYTLSNQQFTYKPSRIFADRKEPFKVLETFGLDIKREKGSDKCGPVKVTFLGKELWDSPVKSTYMFGTPLSSLKSANDRIDYIGNILKKKYYPNGAPPNEHLVYGRIVEKTITDDLVFESTNAGMGRAQTLNLNITNLPSYSLFRGQVVLLDAKSEVINKKAVLNAKKVFYNAAPDLPQKIPISSPNSGPLRIVVAAGPFAIEHNLAYEVYDELIKYVVDNPPDVLILTGPFISISNTCLEQLAKDHVFEEFFESLLEKVILPLQHTDTQIVIVPSAEDICHQNIYPTPPYSPNFLSHLDNPDKVHMVSDPAMLDINGVLFGVTGVDIIWNLAFSEVARQPENTDRMSRLAEYVLAQRCFFPVHYRAAKTMVRFARMNIDLTLLQRHAYFDVIPHVMILPSRLQYFVKNVNGCVVVNPETLGKGCGGMFAEMHIYPNATQTQQSIADNITCKIIKL